jgi:restriction system protein
MPLWLVRAGRHGEQEQYSLEHNLVGIGWSELDFDLSPLSRDELKKAIEDKHPGKPKNAYANYAGQIWSFVKKIEQGDLVVLPLKVQSGIAVGKITGAYTFRTDSTSNIRHIRPIQWLSTLPRTAFDQDLLYSFGAYMTVCKITRHNAEERVRAAVSGKPLPEPSEKPEGEEQAQLDLEQAAQDQILTYIGRKFKGHELARLVDAVLKAEGFVTRVSDPGPDGGVDILAGKGPFGFDRPTLCVQVKSSESPLDVDVLRSLQGATQTFRADQGLLVSWGGFNRKVWEESRRSFFSTRLWDSGSLVEVLLANYERLPSEFKAELPLQRIWALVPTAEDE